MLKPRRLPDDTGCKWAVAINFDVPPGAFAGLQNRFVVYRNASARLPCFGILCKIISFITRDASEVAISIYVRNIWLCVSCSSVLC